MPEFCEQELELRNFGFHHKRPVIFVTSQFGPPVVYPAWLTIQLLYHMIALVIDGLSTAKHDSEPSGNYFLYLTNWSYLLLVISNVVDLSVTLYVHCHARHILVERETKKADVNIIMRNKAVKISYKTMGKFYGMKKYLILSWLLFTMSTVVGITVTLLYGTLDVLSKLDEDENYLTSVDFSLLGVRIGEKQLDFATIAFAYINAIVILLHVFISAKPFRLLHFYLPVAFFMVYTVFSIQYQRYTDSQKYIYSILDWYGHTFRTTGLTYGVCFIVVPLVHLTMYGIIAARTKFGTWFRIRIFFSKWKRTKITPAETEIDPEMNVVRWLGGNRLSAKIGSGYDSNMSEIPSRSRTSSARVDIRSSKSETSL